MSSKNVLVCLTFILTACPMSESAQHWERASAIDGQILLSAGGLKEPLVVLLYPLGSKDNQRTFTDLRGNFEFRNLPGGSYNIRLRLEGFENVNYPVDVPATPFVFIFLNGSAVSARRTRVL